MRLRTMTVGVLALALSACASSERLMDADVRPSDHADCLVGNDALLDRDSRGGRNRSDGRPTLRASRCHPDRGLNWSSERPARDAMNVDFRKKND